MSQIRKPRRCCPPSVLDSILRTKRTAEGCAWGHSLDNFFCAKANDEEDYSWNDVWTTSVLQELGVMDSSQGLAFREPTMRARKPWPVLKISRGDNTFPCLGDEDPGSDHEPEEDMKLRVIASVPEPTMLDPTDVDPFHIDEFPKLEEICGSGTETTKDIVYYKRVYPEPESSEEETAPTNPIDHRDPQHLGHLYLTRQSRIGCGHHSNVYRAAFSLPAPLKAGPTGHVAVVAKIAVPRQEAREFLDHESRCYNSFPDHLAEEFCGYALVPEVKYPVPVGAILPKFFGYYVPDHPGYNAGNIAEPSPILLLEDCGGPIDPQNLSHDNKAECFSMFLRLHLSGFLQKSPFKKNILVQPGPLTVPPEKRSLDSPSFRVIDFGRAKRRPKGNQKEWLDEKETEVKDIQKVLRIPGHSMA
ncbi:hypothetical protein B0H19DRAFT_1170050 [Mycena capillaripes]|nr:hypothetical protein B0H19DRAFT_1170050 [Mycena capillaripes]